MRKYGWIILSLVAMLILGVVIHRHVDRETAQLDHHARAYMKLLAAGKLKLAYAKAMPSFRKFYTFQAFEQRVRPFFKARSFHPREIHVMFSRGTVRAQTKSPEGRTFSVTLMFKKKDHKRRLAALLWKENVTGIAALFFGAIRKGALRNAYTFTAPSFRAKLSMSAFIKWSALHKLQNVREYRWYAVSQTPHHGALSGSLVMASGKQVPCAMMFEKKRGLWMLKIFRFPK